MHISIMLVFWSLVRNSVVLAVYFLFSVTCFFTVHEHCPGDCLLLVAIFWLVYLPLSHFLSGKYDLTMADKYCCGFSSLATFVAIFGMEVYGLFAYCLQK